ncbi:MAG: hypothetical protein AAGC60_00085 [Acidobacteriota bacterium]
MLPEPVGARDHLGGESHGALNIELIKLELRRLDLRQHELILVLLVQTLKGGFVDALLDDMRLDQIVDLLFEIRNATSDRLAGPAHLRGTFLPRRDDAGLPNREQSVVWAKATQTT